MFLCEYAIFAYKDIEAELQWDRTRDSHIECDSVRQYSAVSSLTIHNAHYDIKAW